MNSCSKDLDTDGACGREGTRAPSGGRIVKNRKPFNPLARFAVLIATALVVVAMTPSRSVIAQEQEDMDADDALNLNARPFDFSDAFYRANGINLDELNSPPVQRFGFTNKGVPVRQKGPPAGPGQLNWVVDHSNTN